MIKIRFLVVFLLPTVAFAAFGGQDPAVETRTFKLTYASAVEVAERLNGQMCRELGPDGKPFRVATAYEEANTVTVMSVPDKVAACGRIVADVDSKPKQVYVEARFVALSSSKETITGGRNGGFGSETVFDLANQSKL